jgi:uncharacterized membrane protein YqaE (UPF0057 family)
MLKWLLTLFVTLIVFSVFLPRLAAWLKVGRLPGDMSIRIRGRHYYLPFVSALIFSLFAAALGRLL